MVIFSGKNAKFTKNIKYKLALIITVLGLVGLISGTSYAVLKGQTSSENEQVIKAGSVKLKLTENYESISKKITTLSDEEGLLQEEVYDFNIKNIGNSPAKYDVKLINEIPSDYTGEVLSEDYIKIGLEINDEEHGPFSLSEVKNIIDSNLIYEKEIINYRLRIWLDAEKQEEIMNLEDYKSFLSLKVEAEQRPEALDNKTTLFNYIGDEQEYVVTRDGYYYIELAGGSGGSIIPESSYEKYGNYVTRYISYGAKTSGYIYLNAGEKLYFYVGGAGDEYDTKCRTSGYEFNGGGVAKPAATNVCGYYGGSATDVRLVGGNWDDTESLISRIMVAGAGSGGSWGATYTQAHGGTLNGVKSYNNDLNDYSGNPGTQIAGGAAPTQHSGSQSNGTAGSFGKGGAGGASIASATSSGGCGGGSGYYGGSGGSGRGGAGTLSGASGSSYISGYAGVNSVEENTTITHTNDTLHYSGKYFIGGKMVEGLHHGDGYAKITFVDEKPKKKTTELDGVRYIKNCVNGDSGVNVNGWVEIQAIKDGVNIAKGKSGSIYASDGTALSAYSTKYAYTYVTDGLIDNYTYSGGLAEGTSWTGSQCYILDLEEEYDLEEIAVWNYFENNQAYYDNITYVSSDNSTWTEVIDEASYGTSNGIRKNVYTDVYNGYTQDGLILWYDGYANTGKLHDHESGTWKNLASSSYTGTLTGGTWTSDYLNFDGTSDYVSIAEINPETLTMEVVYRKPSVSTNNEMLVGNIHKGGYSIYYKGDQQKIATQYYIDNEYRLVYNTNQIEYNKIETVSSSYDKNIIKLYTFGALKDHLSYSGSITSPDQSASLTIGANPLSSSGGYIYYSGAIYSVRLYNRVLTDDEIKHNYMYDKETFNLE